MFVCVCDALPCCAWQFYIKKRREGGSLDQYSSNAPIVQLEIPCEYCEYVHYNCRI